MTPEFAQIHTCILRDPNINGLSAESGWNWVRLIVLAKSLRDRGRIGTADEAAYVLHVSPESITQTVCDLGGRITEHDGQLYIRDFSDWQTLTNKERQATFKEAQRNGAEPTVTDGNGEKQPVTDGNGENDKGKVREGNVTEQLHADKSAPRWEPLTTAIAKTLGGPSVYTTRGKPNALAGNMAGLLGPKVDNDPQRAAALWATFVRESKADGSWQYVTDGNAVKRVGKWLASRNSTAKPSVGARGMTDGDE